MNAATVIYPSFRAEPPAEQPRETLREPLVSERLAGPARESDHPAVVAFLIALAIAVLVGLFTRPIVGLFVFLARRRLLRALAAWAAFAGRGLWKRLRDKDPLVARIREAIADLRAALDGAGGAADALAPEVARVCALERPLVESARRLRRMDALLAAPGFAAEAELRALRGASASEIEELLHAVNTMSARLAVLALASGNDAAAARSIREAAGNVEAVFENTLAAAREERC